MNKQQAMAVQQIASALLNAVEGIDEALKGNMSISLTASFMQLNYLKLKEVIWAQDKSVNEELITTGLKIATSNSRFCSKQIMQYMLQGSQFEEVLKSMPCNCETQIKPKEPNVKMGFREVTLEDLPPQIRETIMDLFGMHKD